MKSEDNSSFLEQHEKSLGETADGIGALLPIFSENFWESAKSSNGIEKSKFGWKCESNRFESSLARPRDVDFSDRAVFCSSIFCAVASFSRKISSISSAIEFCSFRPASSEIPFEASECFSEKLVLEIFSVDSTGFSDERLLWIWGFSGDLDNFSFPFVDSLVFSFRCLNKI